MKPTTLVALAIVAVAPLFAGDASARPRPRGYYAQPPPDSQLPGGFHNRQGRLAFGFSGGLGGMHDDFGDLQCDGCRALSGEADLHVGGFVGPRLALLLELQGNIQQVSQGAFVEDDEFLIQSAAMIAGQFWITPQLWLKGGVGFANLHVENNLGESSPAENGLAFMGAAGFEVFSARNMAVDLQGRIINGSYEGIDNNITGITVGVGISWY